VPQNDKLFYSLHQKLKTNRKYLLLHYQIKLYLIVVSYFSKYSIRGLNGLQQWRIKLIYFSMLMYFEKNHCFLLFFQHAHWALKNNLEQHRSIFSNFDVLWEESLFPFVLHKWSLSSQKWPRTIYTAISATLSWWFRWVAIFIYCTIIATKLIVSLLENVTFFTYFFDKYSFYNLITT